MDKKVFGIIGGFITLIGAFILIFLIGPAPQYSLMFRPQLAQSLIVGLLFAIIGIASYWVKTISQFIPFAGIALIVAVFLTNTPIIVSPFYIIGGILYLMVWKKSENKSENKKEL